MAAPPSIWIEALLVTMRFLRTQIRNCRIWSDWKYNGLLPLVVLALSGSEEALWWLLSQLLRYFFVWNLWKWTGRIGPRSSRTKITFSSLANPPPPLLLYWCGDTQKGHLGCCSSLYDSPVLLWPGLYSGLCVGTHEMDVSPSSPSLGNILESYSVTLGGRQRKGQIKQRSWW